MANQVDHSRYFVWQELACKHTGNCLMDAGFMRRLDALREEYAAPMILSSAYRDPKHPKEAEKAVPGMHARGRAVDVLCSGGAAHKLLKLALLHGFTGIGISQSGPPDKRFLHIDDREWATLWTYPTS